MFPGEGNLVMQKGPLARNNVLLANGAKIGCLTGQHLGLPKIRLWQPKQKMATVWVGVLKHFQDMSQTWSWPQPWFLEGPERRVRAVITRLCLWGLYEHGHWLFRNDVVGNKCWVSLLMVYKIMTSQEREVFTRLFLPTFWWHCCLFFLQISGLQS